MAWPDHVLWWQIYPLGFCGAQIRGWQSDGSRQYNLNRIEPWLDYLLELGCNGLLLNALFASTSHGYDTIDYFSIDPRLGDNTDFDHLVDQCHHRGIKICLDGVFNHVGKDFPYPELTTEQSFEGHGDLIELDHHNPDVVELITNVMRYWLARGIDAWRLDAAYRIPAQFWAKVLPTIRSEFEHCWIFAEMLHGDYARYQQQSGVDSITQYELWKAIWSSLKDQNFFELSWALDRHHQMLNTFIPQTFIGNHDVNRIASTLHSNKAAALAAVILFTVGGIPSVYAGDEQGFRGEKTTGWSSDDALRPAFPANPAHLSQAGSWLLRKYQELIAIRRQHPWLVRARVDTCELRNEYFSYRAYDSNSTNHLAVEIWCAPEHGAKISCDEQVLFQL